MPQSTPSGTGASKGSGTADLIDNGGTGGKGGTGQNEAKGQSVSNTKQIGIGTTTTAVDPSEPHSTRELSNPKELGLAFEAAPTADGPWPVPGVSGQFSGGGNLRLLSSNADGVLKLGIMGPGTYSMTLSTQQLAKAVTAAGNTGVSPQPIIAVLIGLLLPAVQKVGEIPQSGTVVQHSYTDVPASASAHRDLTITVKIPEGEGSPTIDWGDGTPTEHGEIVISAGSSLSFTGGGEARVTVVPLPTVEQQSRENGGVIAFQDGHAKFASERGVNFPSGSPAGPAKLAAILFPVFAQAKLGVISTGGTDRELITSDQGAVLLGKLPAGTFDLNISGENLKTWLNTTVSPTNPEPQKTLIELLVVIAIIAMKTDGQPVIVGRTLPATSLPQNLPLKLSVDGNGNPTGTWWDGAPLVALSPNGTNGSTKSPAPPPAESAVDAFLDYKIKDDKLTASRSGGKPPAPAPAFAGSQPISNDDANRLKIELQNILVSSLKIREIGVVTGVFKPEQPLPSSASATIKVPGPTDSEGQPGTPAAMKNSCASGDDEFCASGKHIGNDGR